MIFSSGVPVAFCGTPQQSWQPSHSPPEGDRPQHNQSMRHAVLGGAAAAGTVSPDQEEKSHIQMFLHDRSVYHQFVQSVVPLSNVLRGTT